MTVISLRRRSILPLLKISISRSKSFCFSSSLVERSRRFSTVPSSFLANRAQSRVVNHLNHPTLEVGWFQNSLDFLRWGGVVMRKTTKIARWGWGGVVEDLL